MIMVAGLPATMIPPLRRPPITAAVCEARGPHSNYEPPVRNRYFVKGLTLFALCFTLGCASTQGKSNNLRARQDLLTREEIASVDVGSVFEVVSRLRPQWLMVRGGARSQQGGETVILVYQGQNLLGGVDALRQMRPDAVRSMRYLDSATASASLPGRRDQHVAGAIVITPITQNP